MTKTNEEETINETENVETGNSKNENLASSLNDSERNEKRIEFRLTWGNPKSLVLLGGSVIMWALAILFFAVRIDGNSLLGSESLPVACEVMLGVCCFVAAVMLALFIMSVVLFVQNKKALRETKKN